MASSGAPAPGDNAEIARLRAELEAKDRALQEQRALVADVLTGTGNQRGIPRTHVAALPVTTTILPPRIIPAATIDSWRGTSARSGPPHGLTDEQLARYLQAQEDDAAAARMRAMEPPRPPDAVAARSPAQAHEPVATPTSRSVLTSLSTWMSRRATPADSSTVVTVADAASTPVAALRATAAQRQPATVTRSGSGRGFRSDAELAASMQQQEIMAAYAYGPTAESGEDRPRFDDPVWGSFVAPTAAGFKPHQVLCISMCPCCVPPLCSAERRLKYVAVSRTACFILACIQTALLIVSLGFRGFAPTDVNSMLGPWPDTLDLLQAKNAAWVVYRFHLWRLATPMFLHAGVIHLLSNMIMQLRIGLQLEFTWGTLPFLSIYAGAGVFASAFSLVLKPNDLSVGASGALMGIMGAWVVHIILTWTDGDERARSARTFNFIMAIVNIFIILAFSFVSYVDWAAHVFGLIGGMLLAAWTFAPAHIADTRRMLIVRHAGLWLYLGMLLAALLGLFFNTTPDRGLLSICGSLQAGFPNQVTRCW